MTHIVKVQALGTGICTRIPDVINRKPPAFLVTAHGSHLLLDCSQGTADRLEAVGVPIHTVNNILVSHTHPDHCALPQHIQDFYCDHLFNGNSNTRADGSKLAHSLNIHLPAAMRPGLRQVLDFHMPELALDMQKHDVWPDFSPSIEGLHNKTAFMMSNFEGGAYAREVYHAFGKCPSLGFRIDVREHKRLEADNGNRFIIAYTGDTGIPESGDREALLDLAANADLLITDTSTRVGKEYIGGYGHLGPFQCGQLARDANVKTLWLTHYSGLDPDEAMLAEVRRAGFKGEAVVAKDGQIWER